MLDSVDRIEEKSNELRLLFLRLGSFMSSLDEKVPVGRSMLDRVISLSSEIEKEELALEKERGLESERERDQGQIDEIDQKLKGIPSREKEMLSRLGAIIYELSSLSLLKRDLFSSSYIMREEEEGIRASLSSKNPMVRGMGRLKLRAFEAKREERFYEIGREAIEKGTYYYVDSEKARGISSEILEEKRDREELLGKKTDLELRLSEIDDEIKELKGSDRSSLKEKIDDRKIDYNEALISYGNYLYEKGESWIDENTPPEALDIIEEIIKRQDEYSQIKKKKKDEERVIKREEIKTLIREEEDKLRILEGEKSRIESQMSDIKKEIKRLEGQILRMGG